MHQTQVPELVGQLSEIVSHIVLPSVSGEDGRLNESTVLISNSQLE
jgi:hypothetical protein